MVANWPVTLFAIIPTNNRLMATDPTAAGPERRAMIERWSSLHAVRTAPGFCGIAPVAVGLPRLSRASQCESRSRGMRSITTFREIESGNRKVGTSTFQTHAECPHLRQKRTIVTHVRGRKGRPIGGLFLVVCGNYWTITKELRVALQQSAHSASLPDTDVAAAECSACSIV
jgi:hypothetical protein